MQLDSKWNGVGLQGRDFTIVFRSFGADVADVVEEMDAFATGQHPSYPEVIFEAVINGQYVADCALQLSWQP